ncbi:kelch-like ECH-associated protein 1B isoform X2 [Anthonomus grandis grandis]|nr:kelch-like ECH-associated protein 1B isoform X2 [Anthonomus grandis grandis]XP_050302108.1 kelch-like ECH-associated protein 1B isoform X2 [Anthonomus grandis grandis]XP_050302109.1 kelch-like ECH-associated protein 1B isoform X2 [Anthonomus grandis grandis]
MDGDDDSTGYSRMRATINYPKHANSSCSDQADMSFLMLDYLKDAMKAMDMMRSHFMLTDVTLEVGTELYHAHRVVLAAASPYFKAMFTGGLQECEMARVKLQGLSPTAMHKLISFMYSGRIRVTENTVCQLLSAATMLQIPNVIQACCNFLERQLDPSNAIGIAYFSEQHGCIELSKKANQYIERRFVQICHEEEFLQLSAQQLIKLIRKDELNVQDEQDVYNAVLKWVKYDEDNRNRKMEDILSAVRCQFLPPKFLNDQIQKCDVIKKTPACREYLSKIFKDLTLHVRTAVKERTPNIPRVIYVAGGYLKQSLDILEGFNVDDKTWIRLDRLIIPRSGLGCAFLKGHFYAVGGRNNSPGNSYDSDWVDRYNPILDEWMPCHPMSCPRNRVGVAVMDGLLYAVGGGECTKYHNSVECYDPELDKWILVKPMHYARLAVGVAVVNRILYAIGGFDGVVRHCSAECYHPENDEWSLIPPMHTERSGAGVCAIDKYIYVIGGYNGKQLNTVERYDTENKVWTFLSSMNISRSALSVTVLDGKIYAMGGYDGHQFLKDVEIYDPSTDVWSEGTPLTSGRSGHSSAVCYNCGSQDRGLAMETEPTAIVNLPQQCSSSTSTGLR